MRLRLVLSFAVVVSVAILSVVLFFRLDTENQVNAFMFRGGAAGVENLVYLLEDYYNDNRGWAGVETLFGASGMMHTNPGTGRRQGAGMGMMNQRLRLFDLSGRLLVDTSGSPTRNEATSSELETAIRLQDSSGGNIGYLLPEGSTSFRQGDQTRLLNQLNNVALRAGLIATGIALILALILANQVLRPVRLLTIAAEQLAAGDRSHRVSIQGNDELAILAKSFNIMVDTLNKSEVQRRAMTADIAHELRTPLAVQRANLEALQDGIYPLTADNLQPILDQTNLLARLVEDLRTLALSDSGELRLEKTIIDYPELLEGVIEQFRPTAESRKVIIQSEISESCVHSHVWGDPDRLVQILNNLLSNALRYTPENGQVKAALICSADWLILTIRDNGFGIPENILPNLFERFYRGDPSRSRQEGGTGLGLAIARQLAVAHGGNLQAGNHPDGGALFTLKLPHSQ